MKAQLLRLLVFFTSIGGGLWGLVTLPSPWSFVALGGGFLAGAVLSRLVFKGLATHDQRIADLEYRLHND